MKNLNLRDEKISLDKNKVTGWLNRYRKLVSKSSDKGCYSRMIKKLAIDKSILPAVISNPNG